MVKTVDNYIESWEKTIEDKKFRGIKTLYLIGISFPNQSIPVALERHFSDDEQYYEVEFTKCKQQLWDIIIRWK